MSYVLGISCFYHDAAVCLLKDGKILACAQEERFTREKHDDDFPVNAVNYCLSEAGIDISKVDHVGFYEKPLLKFERILESYIDYFPKSYKVFVLAISTWLRKKLWMKEVIKKELGYKRDIYFIEHHLSHAASSFLVSPFEESAILTVDGVGEWATATLGTGKGNDIKTLKEIHWPQSLGMFYSAFTYYLGFKVNDAEYKVMGAAPYGRPVYADLIKKELIEIKDDGSFKLNLDYFEYHYGLKMVGRKFEKLFGHPIRDSKNKMEDFHWDVAASLQEVTNEVMVKMANNLYKETGLKNICLAGGVALNCVANSKILEQTPFENMFIQPAAGDAGGALGVALYIDNVILKNGRRTQFANSFLGPEFSNEEIRRFLKEKNIAFEELSNDELIKKTAELIFQQKVVGWFQGRMEWGPRALGNRSILADARNKENWQRVNLKIKFRESFRPFAPVVLEEDAQDYFNVPKNVYGGITPAAFMLLIANVKKEKQQEIPAVTHVDGSARLQTISRKQNPLYYDLIKEFKNMTGCPILINTSFNMAGEPIVCSPEDAFNCFTKTQIDVLIMNNFLIDKNA
ncbi:MAG: carbamoyltransferase [Candidatus Nealsonbacteria bacterium]|nr:carbamoyltransferase [Candidatus Nealsonbacteria bacterium]